MLFDAKPSGKNPVRTCAGCGKKGDRGTLLRFVFSPDMGSICDIRMNIQSRGIYFCPNVSCMKKGIRKKAFSKLLRKENAEPVITSVVASLSEGLKVYAYSLMNMALKSKKLLTGDSAVSDGVDKKRVALIIVTADAGRSVKDKFDKISKKHNIPLFVIDEKTYVGSVLGVEAETSVSGVVRDGFAEPLMRVLRLALEVKSWC